MDKTLLSILLSVGGIIVGIVIMLLVNYFKGSNANKKADSILEKARKEAEKSKRDTILEAKEEIHRMKMDAEKEVRDRKQEIKDAETGNVILQGEFDVPPRSQRQLGRLRNVRAHNALWLITWTTQNGSGTNHFFAGNRVMSYEWYKSLLPAIAALDNSFSLESLQ